MPEYKCRIKPCTLEIYTPAPYSYRYRVVSKCNNLTGIVFACHATGPGSNLGEDENTSFFFRLRGVRMRNDCRKIERIAIAINTKPKAHREHATLP